MISLTFNQYMKYIMEYNNGIILMVPRGLRVTSLNNNDMNNLSDIKRVWHFFVQFFYW